MFWKHPTQVCMTYFSHMKLSLGFANEFFWASQKAIIHAFCPDYYIHSTSETIESVSDTLKNSGCRD